MTQQDPAERDSREELAQALGSGTLSDAIAQQGQDILTRMETPLRLSVLGLRCSGKSALMNLLLGSNVFPQDLALPTVSMTYGAEPTAKCTLASGEVQTLQGSDLHAISAMQPAFVELMMPLAALRKLSLMEVVAGDDPAEQLRAVRWAAKRTDIALWCTQNCTDLERQLWSVLPDRIQDHSFLVLTKADALGEAGQLAGLVKNARTVGDGYFRQVLPVATKVALAARQPGGVVDKTVMRSSGAIALISAILREVEAGERAAADAADIFLRQIDFDPKPTKAKTEEPEQTQDTPEPQVEAVKEDVEQQAPAEENVVPISAQAPAPAPTPAPPEIKPDTAERPVAEPAMTDEARALCKQVVDQLAAEGEALAAQLDEGELAPGNVLDVSVDTVTWLADYLADNEVAQEPAMARTCATANDAADLIQLIQLEKGDTVSLDALSLLIQLKHEIQSELAA